MKLAALALAIALALLPLQAHSKPSDHSCVLDGKSAEIFAASKADGVLEQTQVAFWDGPEVRAAKIAKATRERNKRIIAYVFTVDYAPSKMREIVYLKCGLGHFD